MTCQSCQSSVTNAIINVEGITTVNVNLEKNQALVEMNKHIPIEELQDALPSKYTIAEKHEQTYAVAKPQKTEKTKFEQLRPLFLILIYITTAAIWIHWEDMGFGAMMLDFMGLFFIVFSFFKMLDLDGFSITFTMYDPIAKRIPLYSKLYPFIETLLGTMLLTRFSIHVALFATIIILSFTTYGVSKTLLSKRKIKCACLGTALDLPMTEATFIENAIMIIMSISMLVLSI